MQPGDRWKFSRTWTPGVSDNLPLSKHSCFWGIVSAPDDTNAGNNERCVNLNIVGVKKKSNSCSPPGEMDYDGEIEVPFRIDHPDFGVKEILLQLENIDPNNWDVELVLNRGTVMGGNEWYVVVDSNDANCPPPGGKLLIRSDFLPRDPNQLLQQVVSPPFIVTSLDLDTGEQLGEMEVIVDLTDSDGDGIPDIDDNCPDVPNPGQEDADWDRIGDLTDNCPEHFNPDQADSDGDGIGDACDNQANQPGLIAYWRLDETEGQIAYDSVGDFDATVHGGLVWQPVNGQVDGAASLDGIDDFISTPFILNPSVGVFSVFIWIRGGGPGQVIISQTDATDWLLTDPSEGKVMVNLTSNPLARGLLSDSIITDGAWHHVGLVCDGSDRTLYVDGWQVASDMQDVWGSPEAGLYIGLGYDRKPKSFWSGQIDDVRIYNIALSAEEIKVLAQ
jgi:hypothetical protein